MLPINLLSENLNVRRRTSVGRDSLGNPIYGPATDGSGWYTIYENMPAKLAFSGKDVRFSPEGERILPSGTVYYNPEFQLRNEDRILTQEGVEYIVIGISAAYLMGSVVNHYEARVQLP